MEKQNQSHESIAPAVEQQAGESQQDAGDSRWYTDTILQAELADYSPVRGCMVIRPYGYAIWENIQRPLDKMIKDTGHENAYFPIFIPESFLHKEAQHVEGFAPECAVVTHGGGKKLEEPLIVRPTSETIMYHAYAKWIQSWRDLPVLINQWGNVVRWEMRTRLFLRTSEFLWQEGHTAHATEQEADQEARAILEMYRHLCEDYLALPLLVGAKSDAERFAGAATTYCIEALMQDGKALQAGTAHLLGQNFAKAFDVKFQNKDGQLDYVWQTSWAVTTRLIGALVLVHGDEKGLKLPPMIAPLQVVIVPIYKTEEEKETVTQACRKLKDQIGKITREFDGIHTSIRVKVDERDQYTPGWKFNHWEQKGVPLRLNVGPKDIQKNVVEIVRRDTGEKMRDVAQDTLETELPKLLDSIQKNLYDHALKFRQENTHKAKDYAEFKSILKEKGGFIEVNWCGGGECEAQIKADTGATLRVIPFDAPTPTGNCMHCRSKAVKSAIFAHAY